MPRMPLIHIPNGIYSVVSKCNNNEFLFDSHKKFELYINHQIECRKLFGFKLYDIVCMSNHVHELYRVPRKVTIAQILQLVKGGYSRKYNKLFGRAGHFWKNKPFYRIIENEEYALNSMNYFHWNPVRAAMVRSPELWPFSGYRFHVLGEREGLMGKLLEPLPGYAANSEKVDMNKINTVKKVIESQRRRFIGGRAYQKRMREKFGTYPNT